ncbi:MAG: hypothetical protein M3M99_06705 [Actinomycetota bacterium]|nr:hypothetical protein [Actinomycetota bacterium]
MKKTHWLLALALAIGLIAAGCGDDDDDGDSGDALTKQEYIAQGNAICEQGDQEIEAAFEQAAPANTQPTPEQIESVVTETLIPSVQGQIDDLKALPAPEGDEDTLNAIYDDAQTALDGIEADPASVASEDSPDPFADVNQRIGEYGLTACAD